MINVVGKTKRGFGASFELSLSRFLNVFLERKVDANLTYQTLGRGITDDERDELSDHYAEKNWLCSTCEERFERIESYFESNVYKSLFTEKINSDCVKIDANSSVIRLFLYSILWRMANRNFMGFKLSPKFQRSLRYLLDKHMDLKIDNVLKSCESDKDQINRFPISIVTTRFFADTTANTIHFANHKKPKAIMINEYVIIFHEKPNKSSNSNFNFFGLEEKIIKNCFNCKEETFKVSILPSSKFDEIRENIYSLKASSFILDLKILYTEMTKHTFGIQKHEGVANGYVQCFLEGDMLDADRYTLSHAMKSLAQYYHRLGLINIVE
jgi:hypothetical protein